MKVLVINCGSSSLKYQLIDSESEEVLAKGLCERIGIEGSCVTHQKAGGPKKKEEADMSDHTDAVKIVIEKLTDPADGVIDSLSRIAHGNTAGMAQFFANGRNQRINRLAAAQLAVNHAGQNRVQIPPPDCRVKHRNFHSKLRQPFSPYTATLSVQKFSLPLK